MYKENKLSTLQEHWNTKFNTLEGKKQIITSDKALTDEQYNNLKIEVTNKDQVLPWAPNKTDSSTEKTYVEYNEWSKKIDVEILYSGDIKHDGHQFTIKSLGDLETQLKAYKSGTKNGKTGLEGMLIDSGYVQPVRTDNKTFTYELADSKLSIDEYNELVYIHVLEKIENNVIKDLMLKLPVSDLNVKNSFDIKVTETKDDKLVEVPATATNSSLTYHVAVDTKPEIDKDLTTVYIQSTQNNEEVSKADSNKIITNLGFGTLTGESNNQKLTLDNDAISEAVNIYNVEWTTATASTPEQVTTPSQSSTNFAATTPTYSTDVTLKGTLIDGHDGETKEITTTINDLTLQKSYLRDVVTVNEHTSYLAVYNYTNKNDFLQKWKLSIGQGNGWYEFDQIIKEELGLSYFKNTRLSESDWQTTNNSQLSSNITWSAEGVPTITYKVKAAATYTWGDTNLDNKGKEFKLTLATLKLKS